MLTFTRPSLTTVEQVSITKLFNKVPKLPGALTTVAGKMLIENKRLIEKLNDLREKRGIVPLREDADFMEKWDNIQKAVDANLPHIVVKLCIAENIRLTKEINIHCRTLGLPEMKVHKA